MDLPSPAKGWYIYGANWCPYCTNATKLLNKKNIAYKFVNIDDYDGSLDYLREKGFNTIPVIYKNGKYIGGYTCLKKKLKK